MPKPPDVVVVATVELAIVPSRVSSGAEIKITISTVAKNPSSLEYSRLLHIVWGLMLKSRFLSIKLLAQRVKANGI